MTTFRLLSALTIGSHSLLVASATAYAQSARETLRGREVAIFNVAGRVRVESGAGSDVTVEISRGGRDAGRLKVETGTVRGRETLRIVYPTGDDIVYREGRTGWRGNTETRINDDGTWGNERNWRGGHRVRIKSSGSGVEAWADLVVRVPSGKSVAVFEIAGDVDVNKVDADLQLDVSSSHVTTVGTRGSLKIDAGSGEVDVRDASGGLLDVDTGSGEVSFNSVTSDRCVIDTGSGGVGGSDVACGSLKVDVGSGGVRLQRVKSSSVDVDAGSGSVELALTSSPRTVHVETGSGSVTVSLPPSAGALLDIDTGSGGISTEFAVRTTRIERDELHGTIGDGSARIRISTGSGSVRLRKSID